MSSQEKHGLGLKLASMDLIEDLTPAGSTDPAVLRLKQDLTLANSRLLGEYLEGCHRRGCKVVRLDVSEVSIIDSSGLGVLGRINELLRSAGGGITLVGLRPTVRTILRIVQLEDRFTIEDGPSG